MRTAVLLVLAVSLGNAVQAQDILPFPPAPSGSKAGVTIQSSDYSKRFKPRRLPADAPNILIVLMDDLGPGTPSTYGGEIHTPSLDRIARAGISYNRFHSTAMCSPTRAALLTGRNHTRVGNGQIAAIANDFDGFSGVIPKTSATMAEVLKCHGYNTAAFGKWHNTPEEQITSKGPFDYWPTGYGFEYFYGFLAGEASQYEPTLVRNTTYVKRPETSGGNAHYHLSEDLADDAIHWMREQKAYAPDKPWFIYWAPGASHGPHQVNQSWADKYKGKFDDGWDAYRERVFARQKKLGWIPADTKLAPRAGSMASWDSIPEAEKPFQRRLMEVFAGFTEHADAQVGRILDEIEAQGELHNTIVLYIWGDNGSSAEGLYGTISEQLAQNGIPTKISEHITALQELGGLDALGGEKTDNMYHAGWAWAGSTPYQGTKLQGAYFGGIRQPMAISWPKRIKADKTPRPQFHHVNDIVPTIYDILDIQAPQVVNGFAQDEFDGVSMTYTFADAKAEGTKKIQFFDIMASRGIYHDGWFASARGPREPWVGGIPEGIREWSPLTDTWQLYHIDEDWSQSTDLAAQNPAKLEEMKALFLTESTTPDIALVENVRFLLTPGGGWPRATAGASPGTRYGGR
jgi:arylsulfatase